MGRIDIDGQVPDSGTFLNKYLWENCVKERLIFKFNFDSMNCKASSFKNKTLSILWKHDGGDPDIAVFILNKLLQGRMLNIH